MWADKLLHMTGQHLELVGFYAQNNNVIENKHP